MSLTTQIQTIVTALYPDSSFILSSKFKANYESFLKDTNEFPLIILNNEIKKDSEIKINNNVIKDTRIVISFFSPDEFENSDVDSEAIRSEMEAAADRVAVNIYQLLEVRPSDRQKYKCTPEFHVFNSNLTGVTLEMNVNYNEIVNFNTE